MVVAAMHHNPPPRCPRPHWHPPPWRQRLAGGMHLYPEGGGEAEGAVVRT